MLTDDRFCLRREELWGETIAETEYVKGLPDTVWEQLRVAAGITTTCIDLRAHTLQASHVANSFFWKEAGEELGHLPLRLTQGDVAEHVQHLVEEEAPPGDPTCRHIWNSVNICRMPQALFVRVLLLLRDAPCSTGLAEKGHGQGASQKKHHAMTGVDSLCGRAFAAESRPMLARKKDTLREEKLTKDIDALADLTLPKCSARNHFCAQVSAEAGGERMAGAADRQADNVTCLTNHNARFDLLTPAEQLAHADGARREQERRLVVRHETLVELRAQRAVLRGWAREESLRQCGEPNTVSGLRLSDKCVQQLADEWANCTLTEAEVQETWSALVAPPRRPAVFLQERLLQLEKDIEDETPTTDAPWYIPLTAEHRDQWATAKCAFSFEEACTEIYYFLYAKLGPVYAVFLKAPMLPLEFPVFQREGPHENFDPWLKRFGSAPWKYVSDHDMPAGDEHILVLQESTWAGDFLVTRREPILFEDLKATFPPSTRHYGDAAHAHRAAVAMPRHYVEKLREDFPWLTDDDIRAARERPGGGGHGGHGGGGGGGGPRPEREHDGLGEMDSNVEANGLPSIRAEW